VTEIDEVVYAGGGNCAISDIKEHSISVTVQDSTIIAANDYNKSYVV